MTNDPPHLAELNYIPYLNIDGLLPDELQGKIGVYAIFDQEKELQLVNYSRDIFLSLKQHLVRQPDKCYWLKYQIIDRPNRTLLENIQTAWIEENGQIPIGLAEDKALWCEAIDAKLTMTETEKQNFSQLDDLEQSKLLKQIARRVEAQIIEQLKTRGVQVEIRFNPKLKEQGLLDLK